MSRLICLFYFLPFFFTTGCTPSSDNDLVTTVPAGYAAPVAISSLAPAQPEARSWEEKADAIMKLADQEAEPETIKTTTPIQVIKVKALQKPKRVARGKGKVGKRQAQKRAKLKGNLALK